LSYTDEQPERWRQLRIRLQHPHAYVLLMHKDWTAISCGIQPVQQPNTPEYAPGLLSGYAIIRPAEMNTQGVGVVDSLTNVVGRYLAAVGPVRVKCHECTYL